MSIETGFMYIYGFLVVRHIVSSIEIVEEIVEQMRSVLVLKEEIVVVMVFATLLANLIGVEEVIVAT